MAAKDIDQIFWDAAQLATPEERNAYLDQACADSPELRRRVEQLLQAQSKAEDFLLAPAIDVVATIDGPVREGPGRFIGPYKLLEQIGEGGMGLVFVAEQQQPVRRRVALKVLKPGIDSRQIIARFEAERQALALMDHPNIAHVLEAGETPSGLPYFAMELVRGVPITDYCDQNRLSVRERLEVFAAVCRAVQHAHTKGIIHRDIKPSNVLVESHDGTPVAKVIDFGIAKALGQQLTNKTLHTGFAQIIGTPLYMSPEQATLSGLDVDTRSDIYSLGVLLYELLTGTTPFDQKRLEGVSFDEVRRIIREEEAPRPSSRISTLGQQATAVAERRGSDRKHLSLLFRGELDWVVLRALEKDRSRRYETASAFAADVERYLRDEPVEACPPSVWYRWRKFTRRNRGRLAIAAMTLVAVLALVFGGVSAALRSQQDQVRRHEAESEGRRFLARAIEIREHLQDRLRTPGGVFVLVNDPADWQGQLATAQLALENAQALARNAGDLSEGPLGAEIIDLEEQLRSDEADRRLAVALEKVHMDRSAWLEGRFNNVGAVRNYPKVFQKAGLALPDGEVRVLARRIQQSPIREQLLAAIDGWALSAFSIRQFELVERLLAVSREADPDPWTRQLRTVAVWRDPGKRARLIRGLFEGTKSGVSSGRLSPQVHYLVAALLLPQVREAETWLRQAQRTYPADFWLNFELGTVLHASKPEEAIGFYRVAVAVRPKNAAAAHNNLGTLLQEQKDYAGAIRHYEQALQLDPNLENAHLNWARALAAQKDYAGAISHVQQALDIDPNSSNTHFGWGRLLHANKDYAGAIVHYQLALALKHTYDEPLNHLHAQVHNSWALALTHQKDYAGAIAHYEQALKLDPNLAEAHMNWGLALAAHQKDYAAAISHYEQALKLDPNLAEAHMNWGLALAAQQDYAGAIARYRKALALKHTYVEKLNHVHAQAHTNWGNALLDQGHSAGAISHYQEALNLDPNLAAAHYNWGVALYKRQDFGGAMRHCQLAIKLDPTHALAHYGWGMALAAQKDHVGAIACYRKALQLDANLAEAHYGWGNALRALKDFDGAVSHYQRAIQLAPNFAEAHCHLGLVLQKLGRFPEALQSLQKGNELGSRRKGWKNPSAMWVARCQFLLRLDQKATAILQGKAKPASAAEQLQLAELCHRNKNLPAAAARFYTSAFAAEPKLTADLVKAVRYRAARCAVQAAAGQGLDAGKLDDAAKAQLRRQALEWLQAELARYAQLMASLGRKSIDGQGDSGLLGKFTRPSAAPMAAGVLFVLDRMTGWQADPGLASVRDEKELALLPADEPRAWRRIWTEVARVQKQAQARFTETCCQGSLTSASREQVHEVQLIAGKTYVFDLQSKQFDAFLRLEDAQGNKLAENDDREPGVIRDSRIVFTSKQDGTYRIIASAYQGQGTGAYTLVIREFTGKES
jgi:tetratricopeptide (TPR) repeat protein/serine/threonine protein kinase